MAAEGERGPRHPSSSGYGSSPIWGDMGRYGEIVISVGFRVRVLAPHQRIGRRAHPNPEGGELHGRLIKRCLLVN